MCKVFSFRDCVFVPKRTSVTFICRNGKIFFYILRMGLDIFSPPSCVSCLEDSVWSRSRIRCGSYAVLLHATRTRPPSHRDAFSVRSDGWFLDSVSWHIINLLPDRSREAVHYSFAWTKAVLHLKSRLLVEMLESHLK